MDMLGRYNSLIAKHAELERQIEAETAHAHPDDTVISALKKRKLMMKDELQILQTKLPDARQPASPS